MKSNIFPVKNVDEIPTLESTPEQTSDPTIFDTLKLAKAQTEKSKHKISLLKLRERFVNEILNDETKINNEIYKEYFGY